MRISCPVHRIYLAKVSLESPTQLRLWWLPYLLQWSIRLGYLIEATVNLLVPDLIDFILQLFRLRRVFGVSGGK